MTGKGFTMSLGVDPGFAKTGFGAVVRFDDGRFQSAGVELVTTEPNSDKRFDKLRVSHQDSIRHKVIYDAACAIIEKLKPDVLAVEVYTIFESQEYEKLRNAAVKYLEALDKPALLPEQVLPVGELAALRRAVDGFRVVRGRGAAAKTYGVYRDICCAAWRYGIPVYEFMPVDLKKGAAGKASASKDEVAAALYGQIEGLKEKVLAKLPRAKTMHEHVTDAAGHAMLGLRQFTERRAAGLSPDPTV